MVVAASKPPLLPRLSRVTNLLWLARKRLLSAVLLLLLLLVVVLPLLLLLIPRANMLSDRFPLNFPGARLLV